MAQAAVWQQNQPQHLKLTDNADPHRQSIVSTPASFHTARESLLSPLFTPSVSESRASTSVLPDQSTDVVCKTTIREVHVIQLTDDSVQVESESITETVINRKSTSSLSQKQDLSTTQPGPPPPSPPATVYRIEDDLFSPPMTAHTIDSAAESHTITIEESIRERRPPSNRRYTFEPTSTSYETYSSSFITPVQSPCSNETSDAPPSSFEASPLPSPQPHSPTSVLLQPSASSRREPHARRNTTGSTPRSLTGRYHTKHESQPFALDDPDMDSELASDIQLHAAQIRRERRVRQSKRIKAQEAEAALTAADSAPLVGNVIREGHVNYVLMYNMLTGIRIGVSRCQAKIKRPLVDEDFTARHKYSFDIVGNELTPSAKYDFKFKDYAPFVFRELREDVFQLDPADYLVSLTEKYILSELGSPGKSGSFFYFSRDYRFIIKTIRHSEHKFLLKILKAYYAHAKNNPHTLLSRFYGLHRVKLPRGKKIHFVIMNNLFPPHRDIHETYDLKGSTVGRIYPEEKLAQNPRAVLKDLNWINRRKMLELGPEKRALLTEQLRRDSEWLKLINVMDYSLLVGIHNMRRGNRDNVRHNTLKIFSPDMPRVRRKPTQIKGAKSPEAIAMRRAIGSARSVTSSSLVLPEDDTGTLDRQHFLFYQDEGGLRATGEENENLDTIYYLGIIDILTPYSVVKRMEHVWKGMQADRHKISPVSPSEYAARFFAFMKAIMRTGEGIERFKSE